MGRTCSTTPVLIASAGMPKITEVASSCANTSPPAALIARAASAVAAHARQHNTNAHGPANAAIDSIVTSMLADNLRYAPTFHPVGYVPWESRGDDIRPGKYKACQVEPIRVFRLFHANVREFRQLQRILRREGRGHVLHQENSRGKVTREPRRHAHDSCRSASGGGQHHNRETQIVCRDWREVAATCEKACRPRVACHWRLNSIGVTRSRSHHANFRGHAYFPQQIVFATLCMSRSMPPEGFVTNSMAPSSSAFSVLAAPSLVSELTTTMGRGLLVMMCAVACSPSTCGMFKSIVMTSGFSDSESAIASRPSLAWPTTCKCSSALKIDFKDLAHERGIVHDEHAKLFLWVADHSSLIPPARRAVPPPCPSVAPLQTIAGLPAPAW